jgi:hypothetical protein
MPHNTAGDELESRKLGNQLATVSIKLNLKGGKMKNNGMIQHGDVLISRIQALPRGVKPINRKNGRLVLAEGEQTGHNHVIADAGASLLQLEGELYLDVTADKVTITHEEHKPLTIPAGIYKVGIVKEYDYLHEMERRVID